MVLCIATENCARKQSRMHAIVNARHVTLSHEQSSRGANTDGDFLVRFSNIVFQMTAALSGGAAPMIAAKVALDTAKSAALAAYRDRFTQQMSALLPGGRRSDDGAAAASTSPPGIEDLVHMLEVDSGVAGRYEHALRHLAQTHVQVECTEVQACPSMCSTPPPRISTITRVSCGYFLAGYHVSINHIPF